MENHLIAAFCSRILMYTKVGDGTRGDFFSAQSCLEGGLTNLACLAYLGRGRTRIAYHESEEEETRRQHGPLAEGAVLRLAVLDRSDWLGQGRRLLA